MYCYDYPRPAVAVDLVLFSCIHDRWHVLLIQRKYPPFERSWAFPGGFVEMHESLEQAAARELQEEAGVEGISLEQLHTFGAPDRDPRGRTISVAYFGILNAKEHPLCAGDDAGDARWFALDALPSLCFDHTDILRFGSERLAAETNG